MDKAPIKFAEHGLLAELYVAHRRLVTAERAGHLAEVEAANEQIGDLISRIKAMQAA
jgi:hypothetical protein